ncbi:MAG: DUF1743 domain-containing protein [Candidatus Poseidoniaceae archaeon]|nr:DUF1743 domain-containing protein [Candidatus Poseidoniaceae archaeon]
MGWLGLDDTDSLEEGCTTFTFHLLLNGLPESATAHTPRLVRLWPFARQRTRGNAALGVEIDTNNERELLDYLDVFWTKHISTQRGKIAQSTHDEREQFPADPGMVWFSEQPDHSFYFSAVRGEVKLESVPKADYSWGGQGRIGATAAVAWKQGENCTWEAIAWRAYERHGQNVRRVCQQTLEKIDEIETTFLSRDPRKGRALVAPRGPCPVLFGIRSRVQEDAQKSGELLRNAEDTEPCVGMRVFSTNQATDDHLSKSMTARVKSVEKYGRGSCRIVTDKGDWMAFAESGSVKLLAQWLQAGDIIEGCGLSPDVGILHLEKLRIVSATPSLFRPMCSKCNVRMKSMGTGQGSRCPQCKLRTDDVWDEIPRTPPCSSWVQPPHDARRHLARPLEWDNQP